MITILSSGSAAVRGYVTSGSESTTNLAQLCSHIRSTEQGQRVVSLPLALPMSYNHTSDTRRYQPEVLLRSSISFESDGGIYLH